MIDAKIDFARSALEHVEKRIEMMDQKASILMAIQAGFFVFILSIIKEFLGGTEDNIKLSLRF